MLILEKTLGLGRARVAVPSLVALVLGAFGPTLQAESNTVVLEEIVVTATKRDESLQDVAVSVSAIARELKQANIRRLDDIQTYSPNLYIRRAPGIASGANISIRGIGTLDTDKSLDPAIGVMMDGMFLGTASGVLMQNFDIKRIEVLRGPQGTLFGKNTTGGLINIVRGDVTMAWGADLSVTLDEHGREDIKAVVNVPIIDDKFGVKLFAAQIKSDGWVKNTTLNEDVGGDDLANYGFTALWQVADNFDLKLHYEKMQDDSDQGAYVNENLPTDLACFFGNIGLIAPGGCKSTTTDGPNQNSANGRNFSNNEYDTAILTANWDLDKVLVTYIGTSRDMDEVNMQHFDASPTNMLTMNFFNDWKQSSNELRLTSQFDGPFQFVGGLYTFDVDYAQRWDVGDLHYVLSLTGWPNNPGQEVTKAGILDYYLTNLGYEPTYPLAPTSLNSNGQMQETESTAFFVSMDWDISDALTLTVGGRYTVEEKDFVGGNLGIPWDPAAGDAVPGLYQAVSYNDEWKEFTPSASLSFQVNDNVMVWGSASEGFKSGGFFGRQANFDLDSRYQPEYVTSYELGMKSTFLDGRLTFNPTIFMSDYEDKQESILIPVDTSNVATVVRNASTEEINGLELEVLYQVSDKWFLRANYGYIDASYKEYLADIDGGAYEITDNSYLTPRNTPENTYSVSTTYTTPVGAGSMQGILSYRFRDEVELEATNNPLGHMDSIRTLSAQLSYRWSDDRYRVTVYGKNLTDEREIGRGLISPLTTRGWWNPPRTYGAEFSMSL